MKDEIPILLAIRNGADTKGKIAKSLGNVPKDYVEKMLESAIESGLIQREGRKYSLTLDGAKHALAHEYSRPLAVHPPPSIREIVVDKGVGGAMMAVGLFLLYLAFQLSMDLIATQPPQLSQLSSPQQLGEAMGQLILYSSLAGVKFLAAMLVAYIGGVILSRGVQLFRRPAHE